MSYKKLIAWSIHIFTSLGLLSAFMALISIDQRQWRECYWWLLLCFLIDAIDGTLARKFKVDITLPEMDGKSIDYVIDFTTYAVIPAFFFYKAEMTSPTLMTLSITIMLLSSALYYGKKNMVEDGQYFIGFPVLWNFVVFYQFFIFENRPLLNFSSVIIFGILHFIPLKFAYPSQAKKYFKWHLMFTLIGIISTCFVLWSYPRHYLIVDMMAVMAVLYFFLFAIFSTLKS